MARRLMLGATYLLLAVIVGLAVPFGITLGRRLTDELGGRVEREAFATAAAVEDFLETGTRERLQPTIRALAREIGGRVLVTDPAGVLLADSLEAPGSTPPSYASRPEIANALDGQATWAVRHSGTLDEDLLVSAVPVRSGNRILGTVRVSFPMSEVNRSVHRSYWVLASAGLVALVMGLILSGWLARWVVRPLRSAAEAARQITAGDLDSRVPVEGPPEVRELARDLNAMTEELADLLRANREFAANASHQLRTPLTALRLSLESASEGGDPRREVEAALEQAVRLEKTVDALLALADRQETPVSVVPLAETVRQQLSSLDPVDIHVDVHGRAVAVADPERVRQVVAILVGNALRFAASTIRITVLSDDRGASLRVDDDGPGVPVAERERVFDRFFRGSTARGPGTGLGLSVARELARADGGRIAMADSSLGGACFEVLYTAADALPSSSAEEKYKPTPRTVRI